MCMISAAPHIANEVPGIRIKPGFNCVAEHPGRIIVFKVVGAASDKSRIRNARNDLCSVCSLMFCAFSDALNRERERT